MAYVDAAKYVVRDAMALAIVNRADNFTSFGRDPASKREAAIAWVMAAS